MVESNVAERLKLFIESKGLSYSQFADACGIPRPSLSQLLTGRNKKISDVMVGQIHNEYPELSILWLLFGEGSMIISKDFSEKIDNSGEPGNIFDIGLFGKDLEPVSESKKIVFSHSGKENIEISQAREIKDYKNAIEESELKIVSLQDKIKELQSKIETLKKNPRKVSHITVYYDDYTFETFFPR